jgi:cysteinyl-tRNA synthetase
MSRACLGPVIDLHTGGEDNVFPHHECEIAQSFGAADGPDPPVSFSRFWVHGRHLLVDNRKMSKRDGTFFTVRDLLDPRGSGRPELAAELEPLGFAGGRVPAPVLRYALMSTPFGLPLNFSFELLVGARTAVTRLQGLYDRLREAAGGAAGEGDAARAAIDRCRAAFDAALDDDLDVSGALAAVGELVGELNQRAPAGPAAAEALAFLDQLDDVLAVLDRGRRAGLIARAELAARRGAAELPAPEAIAAAAELDPELVEQALVARDAAKAARDFARADALRRALSERGVVVDDTPLGVRWTFV